MITTNYDTLIEKAAKEMGIDLVRLPEQAGKLSKGCDKQWLMKMQGSVEDSQSIILTKEHYYRYSKLRVALLGIVAAVLVTKEVLIVGVSLADANFHLVVNELKGVLKEKEPDLATAIMAMRDDEIKEFWEKEVNFVFSPGGCIDLEKRMLLCRNHDIMLDAINLLSASAGKDYFFHPSFDVLSQAEKDLKTELERILKQEQRLQSPVFQAFKQFHNDLGAENRGIVPDFRPDDAEDAASEQND